MFHTDRTRFASALVDLNHLPERASNLRQRQRAQSVMDVTLDLLIGQAATSRTCSGSSRRLMSATIWATALVSETLTPVLGASPAR